jgi:hypothetical protein
MRQTRMMSLVEAVVKLLVGCWPHLGPRTCRHPKSAIDLTLLWS